MKNNNNNNNNKNAKKVYQNIRIHYFEFALLIRDVIGSKL